MALGTTADNLTQRQADDILAGEEPPLTAPRRSLRQNATVRQFAGGDCLYLEGR